MQSKVCSRCGYDLPFSNYRPSKLGKYGLHSVCIECAREYARAYQEKRRRENPEKVKEEKRSEYHRNKDRYAQRKRENYASNREQLLEKANAYREANREAIRQWHRGYRRANLEKRKQKDRKYYQANKIRIAQRNKQYRASHRIEILQNNRIRKLKLRDVKTFFTADDWSYALNYFDHRCAACGRPQGLWHIIAADHWIPLSRGGQTAPDNIVPLCHGVGGCNNSKRDADALNWLISRFGPRRAAKINDKVHEFFNTTRQGT